MAKNTLTTPNSFT